MFENVNNGQFGELSDDTRLRYSRRAILFGLIGAGALVGFGGPARLLGQTSGGNTASADEGDKEDKKQREDSGDSDEEKDPEKESEQEPEKEPAPEDPTMRLYVPRLAIRGDTVADGDSEAALAHGAMKLPSTGYPWQDGANPYIAGHRIGYPGRESRYQFYNLPAMRSGDPIFLRDANGTGYEYRVIEKFAVSPAESWVTEPVEGKDLVTLQTCVDSVARSTWWYITPKLMEAGPDTGRLIVRAERV